MSPEYFNYVSRYNDLYVTDDIRTVLIPGDNYYIVLDSKRSAVIKNGKTNKLIPNYNEFPSKWKIKHVRFNSQIQYSDDVVATTPFLKPMVSFFTPCKV